MLTQNTSHIYTFSDDGSDFCVGDTVLPLDHEVVADKRHNSDFMDDDGTCDYFLNDVEGNSHTTYC